MHNNPYLQLLVWQYSSKTVSAIFCFAFFFVRDIYYKHFKSIANPRARLVSFCRNRNGVPGPSQPSQLWRVHCSKPAIRGAHRTYIRLLLLVADVLYPTRSSSQVKTTTTTTTISVTNYSQTNLGGVFSLAF